MNWLRKLGSRSGAGERAVLLHGHMFKNAGSTFDFSLGRSFAGKFVDHRDDEPMREQAGYLADYLLQNPDVTALSSHWLALPLPALDACRLHLALFFRDPVERIGSIYRFEQQQAVDHPGTRTARAGSLQEYVRWRLQPTTGPVLRNFHSRYCSGDYRSEDAGRRWQRALATLDATPLLGLVHRYAESIVLFEHLLRPHFPGIDLAYTRQNRSEPEGERSLQERRAEVESRLGPLLPEVLAANDQDIALLAEVERRFELALAQVPELPQRLEALQRRCEALS